MRRIKLTPGGKISPPRPGVNAMPGPLIHIALKGPRLKDWFKKRPTHKDKADNEKWDTDADVTKTVMKLHKMTEADYTEARII